MINNPFKTAIKNPTSKMALLIYIWIAIIILIAVITYTSVSADRQIANNDSKISRAYQKYPPQISNINSTDAKFKFNNSDGTGSLCDYYIASSYNSCCGGDFQSNYVSITPLKNVIFHGARVLDFAIYSINNNLVVAASPNDSFYIKGTYNSIPLGGEKGVLSTIDKYAFTSGTAPNPEDPLFIHLRIKTDKKNIYGTLTNYVKNAFPRKLLNATYGYEGRSDAPGGGKNLATEPLLNLRGKVIIICDQINKNYRGTPFEELVNISGDSAYFKEYHNYDIQYTHNPESLQDFNKQNITLTMPDMSAQNNNISPSLHFSYGCQMVCMNYQNLDNNMKFYLDKFNSAGTAFILQPDHLRYYPVTITAPPQQNPKLSYASREIDLPMYKTSI